MIRISTGKNPQGHANHNSQEQRTEGQFEGGWQPLQNQAHGVFVIDKTLPEVAVDCALEKDQVLLPQRLVQPQVCDGLHPFGLIEVFPHQDVHGIANGIQADKHHEGHQQNHQQRLSHSSQRPADHRRNSAAVGWLATHSSPNSSGSAKRCMVSKCSEMSSLNSWPTKAWAKRFEPSLMAGISPETAP